MFIGSFSSSKAPLKIICFVIGGYNSMKLINFVLGRKHGISVKIYTIQKFERMKKKFTKDAYIFLCSRDINKVINKFFYDKYVNMSWISQMYKR